MSSIEEYLMNNSKWADERKQREKDALKRHASLHKLFVEDRLSFERKRKRMIDEVINSAEDDGLKSRLKNLQDAWDKAVKGAGSEDNRLIISQTLFWNHFYNNFYPAVQKLLCALNGSRGLRKV